MTATAQDPLTVQTWRPLFDPPAAPAAITLLTWEIEEGDAGVTMLTVKHELADAPRTAALVAGLSGQVGGGWIWVLSDLKTLLETGRSLAE
jgi:hypothetical protein